MFLNKTFGDHKKEKRVTRVGGWKGIHGKTIERFVIVTTVCHHPHSVAMSVNVI